MDRQTIDPLDYAVEIMKGLRKGALVTTRRGDEVNTMTVAWGFLGIEWNRLIFNALVRESRYTHRLLDESGEFSVNIPLYAGTDIDRKAVGRIMGYCGTKSGRDTDKIADMNLTLFPGDRIAAPGILEAPLTLECRVLYRQDQELSFIPSDILDQFYPPEGESGDRDYHTMYLGEVVGAFLLEK